MRPIVNCLKYYCFLTVLFAAGFLNGCGGGGAESKVYDGSFYHLTGKLNSAPADSKVSIQKVVYSIYSTDVNGTRYYGSKDSMGGESLKVDPVKTDIAVSADGTFSLPIMQAGSYIVTPAASGYSFKSDIILSRTDSGVVTITNDGKCYIYDPDEIKPEMTDDRSTLYTVSPALIADSNKNISGFDFTAAQGGGLLFVGN